MKLKGILLKREELPIGGSEEFSSSVCIVPIHPSLKELPPKIKFDRVLAYNVVNDAIDLYIEDLSRYCRQLGDSAEKSYLEKLPVKRNVWSEGCPLGSWRVYMVMSQDFLYSLGLTSNCHIYPERDATISSSYVKFSKEKFLEFSRNGEVGDLGDENYYCRAYFWGQHNVLNIPEAIMLRDWSILYENILLKILYGE